ncbi:hypothetical protein CTI12_AA236880 [Artemisia annua]|uniref:Uncharacterized protein n=1 Tax=Artemisia annua TaxID=35608 RepID=A0A2U1N6V4_ARTAN|nr:hypothetical protein CTI12_AA236880 [Artemisia annua]
MEGGSSTDQDERDLKQKAEQESKERDRKGKVKVEESDDVPAPTPEIRSFIDNDHHYIKIIGQLPVGPNSVEGVTRELVRIRAKDVQKILGNQDGMLMSIHSVSGATIGIFTDATARFHCHAYLELLGTADQIKIAELLVTDAITEYAFPVLLGGKEAYLDIWLRHETVFDLLELLNWFFIANLCCFVNCSGDIESVFSRFDPG